MVVLNSKRAVHELVDKRSAIYALRPKEEQVHRALKGENFSLVDTNIDWRIQRKLTVRFLAPKRLDGIQAKVAEAEYIPSLGI